MTVSIGELMRDTLGREFRADVQITQYWSPQNLDLLKQYIFTYKPTGERKSSIDLLRTFTNVLANLETEENRFVVIATYGHGKSHFALALANYFGKPADSEESRVVLRSIRHAIPGDDLGTYGHLESFKSLHKPYLVLLLRGDEPSDLSTKFHQALKEALDHEPGGSGGEPLPFWFGEAEAFIDKISQAQQIDANRYLSRFRLDLAALRTRIRSRDASVHDICVGLLRELMGVTHPFSAGLSLEEAVKWLVENKCGPNGPYAGLLVLFDEFSVFVKDYPRSPLPGAPLQDLLNGIRCARGRAVFVAFSQHSPRDIARSSAQGEALSSVEKELDRLPRQYVLHSSLEEVLQSYLGKQSDLWLGLLRDDKGFRDGIDAATTQALRAYHKRYIDQLKWGTERFHDVVTVGCFPLHPLTTAVLCSVELQATTAPRSVLGFVQGMLDAMKSDPAKTSTGPSWVRAISLVDYFKEMLGQEIWERYSDALQNLLVPYKPEEIAVLKALLLQRVGQVDTDKLGFVGAIAELSGLAVDEVTRVLEELARRDIVWRDTVTGYYTLPPVGGNKAGKRLLETKIGAVQLDVTTLERSRADLTASALRPITDIPVEWGHSEDWSAEQLLVVRGMVTSQFLAGVSRRHLRLSLDAGAQSKARSLVIWAVATNEEDVEWYRGHLPAILAEAFGDAAAPLVVMRPKVQSTVLIDRLKRYLALKSFTGQEKAQAGTDWYRNQSEQAERDLREAFASYQEQCVPEVPTAFRAQINRAAPRDRLELLREVIQLTYPYSPKSWYKVYKLTTSSLLWAVSRATVLLLTSGKPIGSPAEQKPPEGDVVRLYLKANWRVLDSSNRPTPPSPDSPLYQGWSRLDQYFQSGGTNRLARPVLEELLNSPFGYDWNTLSLLFASWHACHRLDLAIDLGGHRVVPGEATRPFELLLKVAGWSINRSDPSVVQAGIDKLVRDVRSGRQRTAAEAYTDLQQLKEYVEREGISDALREQIQEALGRLQEDSGTAKQYDEKAKVILRDSDRENLSIVLSCLTAIRDLPSIGLVLPEQPPVETVSAMVRSRLTFLVDRLCTTLGNLKQLEDYANNRNQLTAMAQRLDQAQLTSEADKARAAIATLEQEREVLTGRVGEENLRKAELDKQAAILKSVQTKGPMSVLLRGLETLGSVTPVDGVKRQWESKRREIEQELGRLRALPAAIEVRLGLATDSPSVQRCRDEALRAQTLCDEDEARRAVEAAVKRADVLADYLGRIAETRGRDRACPEDFARDIAKVQQLTATSEVCLSEAQCGLAAGLEVGLKTDLASRRRAAAQHLERLEEDVASLKGAADCSRAIAAILRELSGGDWVFLPPESQGGLAQLRQEVQTVADEENLRKAELDKQKAVLAGVQTHGPMSVLLSGLQTLGAVTPADEVKRQWESKRRTIEQELARLRALPAAIEARLGSATDSPVVQKCRDEALRAQTLCDEDEARRAVEGLLTRAEALTDYLGRVAEVRRRRPACPEDFARDIAEVHELARTNDACLSEAQRGLATQLAMALKTTLESREQAAVQCLGRLEEDIAGLGPEPDGSPIVGKALQELSSGDWVFLPAEARGRLAQVRQEVQAAADKDELHQVEKHFLSIRDPEKRRECLQRLQQLVEEAR